MFYILASERGWGRRRAATPCEGARRESSMATMGSETFRSASEKCTKKVRTQRRRGLKSRRRSARGSSKTVRITLRPFSTDKNKKQKSDILNFLVVCFTICFFLFLSNSLTLRFRCFSIFLRRFCFFSKFLGHSSAVFSKQLLSKNLLISN